MASCSTRRPARARGLPERLAAGAPARRAAACWRARDPCRAAERRSSARRGLVGRDVDQHRTHERVPAIARSPPRGAARRRRRTSAERAGPAACRRGERGEPPAAQAVRVEHEARAVDHRRPLRDERRPARPARPASASSRPICPKPSRIDVHPLGPDHRAAADARELEGARGSAAAPRPASARLDDERDVELRRALRDGDDVDPRRPRAPRRRRAAMPGVPCIPSPTTAIVAMPGCSSTPSISRRAISSRTPAQALARRGAAARAR